MSHVTMLYVTYNMWQKLNWDFSRLVFWLFNCCDELSSRNFLCGCWQISINILFIKYRSRFMQLFSSSSKNLVFWQLVLYFFDIWQRDASIYSIKSFIWVSDSEYASLRHTSVASTEHFATRAYPYQQKMDHFAKKASLRQKIVISAQMRNFARKSHWSSER